MHYRNLDGSSQITAYETGPDSITLRFGDGWACQYTATVTGRDRVEHMKELAVAGRGLCAYAREVVRGLYARRWRD